MPSLIAIDMPAGQRFVDELKQIWDSGDALLPIDQRLPHIAKNQLLKQLGASYLINHHGERLKLEDGFAVGANDALVIATSGSTGTPKGVVHTHESIRAAIVAGGSRLECSSADHWLACLSLAHVGGLSVVLRALHYESKLTIEPKAEPTTIANALNNGATMTSLVPTIIRRVDVAGFRSVLVGGSEMVDALPTNAIATYGLSETMGGIAYNGQALDGVSLRISTDDEIQIRGAMLFREYRDGTNPKTHDGWFATGDLGELDSHRKLKVLGRRDDLINTGGFKVWPKTVEDSINEMAGVTECVVRGLPDENWGTAVCAWILLENQKRSFNIDTVRLHVKKSLPDYCAPQKLFIVDQIPRSALGKVQISELLKLNTLAL